jgi:hypothetical protein
MATNVYQHKWVKKGDNLGTVEAKVKRKPPQPCSKEALDDEKILDALEEAASWTMEETLSLILETLEAARARGDRQQVEVLEKLAEGAQLLVEAERSGNKQEQAPDVAAAIRLMHRAMKETLLKGIAAGNPFAPVVLATMERWEEEHKPN